MAKVKFISSEYLKENTPIDGNVSTTLLEPFIIKAQDIHIQQCLGTKLYEAIKALIVAGTIGDGGNVNYKALLDNHIRPTLSEWVLYESMPFIGFKLTNKSVSQKSSEDSQPTGLDEIKWLRQSVRDSAEFYTKRMSNYLSQYQNLFTELTTSTDISEMKPFGKSYFGGVYLGRTGKQFNEGRGNGNYDI